MPDVPPVAEESPVAPPETPEETPASQSTLTLDVSGDDTFADCEAGENLCVTVWGTVEFNDGDNLVLAVERVERMPEGYESEGGGEEGYGEEEAPVPVAASRTTVKAPGALPKSVVSIMIGKKK